MELNPMKTTLKILLAVSVLSAVAAPAIAQSSAATSETTSVTIITPIAIAPVTPLSFGSVSVGATAGTIVLPATGSATYTGLTGQVFGVTLAGTSLTSGALAPILLSGLTNAGSTTLIAAGNDITVGGTLTLAASQAAGTYNGTVTATVTYN
jgi:spore coat protein U-like protein